MAVGLHVQSWVPTGTYDTVAAANAGIVKVMDADTEPIRKLLAQRPDLIVVVRQYFNDSQQAEYLQQGYAGGMLCARAVAATYREMRDVVPPDQFYAEALNETGLWQRADAYDAFTVGFSEECAKLGMRPAVYCFPTGNPPGYGNPPDLKSYWAHYVNGLRAAKAANGALALHEYSWPTMQKDATWLCLRYRRVIPILPEDVRDIPILITECGIDYGASGLGRRDAEEAGWRHTDPPTTSEMYADQLRWYAGEIAKDRQVIGATVFTAGNADKWTSFDVTGVEPVISCLREVNARKETPMATLHVDHAPDMVAGQPWHLRAYLEAPGLVNAVATMLGHLPLKPDETAYTQDFVAFKPIGNDGVLSLDYQTPDVPDLPAEGIEVNWQIDLMIGYHGRLENLQVFVKVMLRPAGTPQEAPVIPDVDGDKTPAGIRVDREPQMWGKIWGWSGQAVDGVITGKAFGQAFQAAVRWGKGETEDFPSDPR